MTNLEVQVAEPPPLPASHKSPPLYRQRVLAVAVVAIAPWVLPITSIVGGVAAGSRSVFVIVVPILAWILVTSFQPPSGVVDNEVDWIVALLGCTTAAATIALFSHRIPSLMQLWRIDAVGPVLWTATATAIFLGVRYAAQLWDFWLLLLLFVSPFPFLLMVSAFGGSDFAVAGLSCGVAAVVVARATRSRHLGWISGGFLASAVVGGSAAWLVLSVVPSRHLALLTAVFIGSGIVPLVVTRIVLRFAPLAPARTTPLPPAKLSTLSRWGVVALFATSIGMVFVLPYPPQQQAVVHAADNWPELSGLKVSREFTAATALLGPHAHFTRFVSSEPSVPPVAVDVITAPTRGILDDFVDAQWYSSAEPVDFVSAKVVGAESVVVRSAHSNADTAVDPSAPQWYSLTWTWRVDSGFQQVIVVVSQHEEAKLPVPTGITPGEIVLDPLLWIARQQPRLSSDVDSETIEVAHQLAARVIRAAGVADASGT